MNIAFVGIEKDWKILQEKDYIIKFVRFHLELPFYYFYFGNNNVDIVTDYEYKVYKQYSDITKKSTEINLIYPEEYSKKKYDIVIHWRKWFDELYKNEAINVINCQDHSFSQQWKDEVVNASNSKKLYGILCFPTWHERNLKEELQPHSIQTLSGVTLGVDTSVYIPSSKKRRHDLLWASDIGRGAWGAIELACKLFQKDKRYKLHICWPDYLADDGSEFVKHEAITIHRNLDNDPKLWNLFNECGFLPYTSTFKEPSSRVHIQAMAAGCVVLYPSDMGTPSELIKDTFTGHVGGSIDDWIKIILDHTKYWECDREQQLRRSARVHAISENWEIQTERFNKLFNKILENKNG